MMAIGEDGPDGGPAAPLRKLVLTVLLGLITVFALGTAVGAAVVLVTDPDDRTLSAAIVAIALAIAVPAIWGLIRLKAGAAGDEPVSPKVRKANNLLLLSGAIGGVLGAALSLSTLGTDTSPAALFSNSPLPRAVVIPSLIVWLLIVPLISWQWHRTIDEHEAEAYRFGGLAGLYLYAFLAPAWWFAWRGGLVPAPDTMAIYLVVMTVWGIGWYWRRYR